MNKKFVTFEKLGQYGRIGNQLWQVAACIGLAAKNNGEAIFKRWYCSYTKKDMLPFFKNPVIIDDIHQPVDASFVEPNFYYEPIPPLDGGLNIHGYFQSEKYFSNVTNLVKYYFEPARETEIKLRTKYAIALSGITCSIHIRRGDYVGHSVHDVCNLSYYEKAISVIESKTMVEKFLLFSDDIDWCKKHFRGNRFVFVEGNQDIEDLFLMSFCDHNIICNSSFSWWGSYLNKNRKKIVVSPDKWFNDGYHDDRDIFTEDMIKINVSKKQPPYTQTPSAITRGVDDVVSINQALGKEPITMPAFSDHPQPMPNFPGISIIEKVINDNPKNLPINKSGAWEHQDLTEHVFDPQVAFTITNLMHDMGIRSCIDFGCGTGAYVDYLNTNNIPSVGYDGNPFTPDITAGKCKVIDLSKPFNLGVTYDCVLSLEVGEHIPTIWEQNFISNLVLHSKRLIIISWAIPGQGGLGHVNCRDNNYIKDQFAKHGFRSRSYLDNILRKLTAESWFANTLMIFEKN